MNSLIVLQKKNKKKTKNNNNNNNKEKTTTTTKKNKWICIFDFGILTKALWLQGTIVQNASVTQASLNSSLFRTSSSFFRWTKREFTFSQSP